MILIPINMHLEDDVAGRVAQEVREAALPIDMTVWTALAALADPVRLRIILMLRQQEQCVCHLTEGLALTQGTVSYHMGILKRAGLVRERRDAADGRWVYYRLHRAGVVSFQAALSNVLDATRADSAPAPCYGEEYQDASNAGGEA